MLIEHDGGNLPVWLAPVQAVVMSITEKHDDYCREVAEALRVEGARYEIDLRNEKINYKIREHAIARIPFVLVAGDREMETGTVAVRRQDGKNLGAHTVEQFVKLLKEQYNMAH